MNKVLLTLLIVFAVSRASAQQGVPTAQDIRAGIAGEIKFLNVPPEKVVSVKNQTLWTGTDSVKVRFYDGSANRKLPLHHNVNGGALFAGSLVWTRTKTYSAHLQPYTQLDYRHRLC